MLHRLLHHILGDLYVLSALQRDFSLLVHCHAEDRDHRLPFPLRVRQWHFDFKLGRNPVPAQEQRHHCRTLPLQLTGCGIHQGTKHSQQHQGHQQHVD